jgi:aromatic ring-cleaving dioxygenase
MISDYHFHLYFSEDTRGSAAAIHALLSSQHGFAALPGALREAPVGPHTLPQFRTSVPSAALEPALLWYLQHRGEHTVLIHPNSGDDLLDHTKYAVWLGTPLPLDVRFSR